MELMVVVAIIGVCLGIISLSISTISSAQARKTAGQLDASISKCKLDTLGRARPIYMTISQDGDSVHIKFYENDVLVSDEVIGGSRAQVSYTIGGTETALSSGELAIAFVRDTGAFDFSRCPGGAACTAINVTGGGRTYTIELVPSTGAHTLGG